MKDQYPSRRQFLDGSLLAIPALARSSTDEQQGPRRTALTIVCLGAHPDDPDRFKAIQAWNVYRV